MSGIATLTRSLNRQHGERGDNWVTRAPWLARWRAALVAVCWISPWNGWFSFHWPEFLGRPKLKWLLRNFLGSTTANVIMNASPIECLLVYKIWGSQRMPHTPHGVVEAVNIATHASWGGWGSQHIPHTPHGVDEAVNIYHMPHEVDEVENIP